MSVEMPCADSEMVICGGTHGAEVKNKLIGWIDSDFGSDPVTRKSMTVQLMSLNDDTISWRSPRQGVVTLAVTQCLWL
jgi:hypothetical protein